MADWYCKVRGTEVGPLSGSELKEMARTGRLLPQDSIRHGLDGQWVEANRVTGLEFGTTSPSAAHTATPPALRPKPASPRTAERNRPQASPTTPPVVPVVPATPQPLQATPSFTSSVGVTMPVVGGGQPYQRKRSQKGRGLLLATIGASLVLVLVTGAIYFASTAHSPSEPERPLVSAAGSRNSPSTAADVTMLGTSESNTDSPEAPAAGWVTYRSHEGRFLICLPHEPEQSTEYIKRPTGSIERTRLTASLGNTTLVVDWLVMSKEDTRGRSEESILNRLALDSRKDMEQYSAERHLQIDGHPVTEMMDEGGAGPALRMRLYVVAGRHYCVGAVGSPEDLKSPIVDRFLDSFRLLQGADCRIGSAARRVSVGGTSNQRADPVVALRTFEKGREAWVAGDYSGAEERMAEAIAMGERAEVKRELLAYWYSDYAFVLVRDGHDMSKAAQALDAIEAASENGWRDWKVYSLKAEIFTELGRGNEARAAKARAQSLRRSQGGSPNSKK